MDLWIQISDFSLPLSLLHHFHFYGNNSGELFSSSESLLSTLTYLITCSKFSVVKPTPVNTFVEQPSDQAKQNNPTTEKWAGTLRRRDPDIQPTLPSIVSRKTSSTSVSSGRKTRSVERAPRRRLVPIKPIVRKTDVPAEGDVTMLEKDEKIFNTSGYEIHLVETLERDILQKNPDVRWRDVIGLDDAKSVLQEAMVLPLVMPDYFKVIRLCNVINDVMYV